MMPKWILDYRRFQTVGIKKRKGDNLLHNIFEGFYGLNCFILTTEIGVNV
jgi:hypothetical protein